MPHHPLLVSFMLLSTTLILISLFGIFPAKANKALKKWSPRLAVVLALNAAILLYQIVTEIFIAEYSGSRFETANGSMQVEVLQSHFFAPLHSPLFCILLVAPFLILQLLWIRKIRESCYWTVSLCLLALVGHLLFSSVTFPR